MASVCRCVQTARQPRSGARFQGRTATRGGLLVADSCQLAPEQGSRRLNRATSNHEFKPIPGTWRKPAEACREVELADVETRRERARFRAQSRSNARNLCGSCCL